MLDNTTAAYIKQAIYRITDYLRLKVSTTSLDQLIKEVKHMLKLQNLPSQPQLIIQKHTQVPTRQADIGKIVQLLVDSIVYLQGHNPTNKPITLGLEDTTLGHTIDHMQDYIRKLAALKITVTTQDTLPSKQALYKISPTQAVLQNPQTIAPPALLENMRIMDAHYGYTELHQRDIQVYVIPVNICQVRGKVMELLRKRAALDLEELKHPLAIELEKKLLEKIQHTQVDLWVIHKALDTIKKYHGGIKRKSGEPFFTHPMHVALILLNYSQDQEAIVSALLHDTVEDTGLSIAHIRAMFGDTVAFLVGKATNLEDQIRRISLQDHEKNHRLMNYEDPRAALVKLSDRLHNMRTIQGHASLSLLLMLPNHFIG